MKLIVKLNKDYGMAFLIATHDKRFKKVSTLEYKLFNGDLKNKWMKIILRELKDY